MEKPPILIVDDDLLVLRTVKQCLQILGFEVVTARNGQEALDYSTSQPFLLVITDINMPIKNGIEFIEQLKAESPQLKIIAMSGEHAELKRALTAGASSILPKPFTGQELILAVQNV